MTASIKNRIRRGMARAFFACAWADMVDDDPESDSLSGLEITQVMPRSIDSAAWHAADTLCNDLARANAMQCPRTLYLVNRGDPSLSADDWGHYCAMQSMGHGVGLSDYGIEADAVNVPYVEFGSHSLSRDYRFKRG